MKRPKPQSAFSLIEVLFAVMVLTIGLVFVASQFPIGLANSRDIARASTNPINAHNTQTTLSLLLQNEIDLGNISIGNNSTFFLNSDGRVHFLIQPNYRWPSPANTFGDFVLDEALEPLQSYFDIGVSYPYPHLLNQPYGIIPIAIPSYFRLDNGVWWSNLGQLLQQNIGMMVCPPVTGYDKDVEYLLRNLNIGGGPFWPPSGYTTNFQRQKWDQAIFDIASKRNYSWCAFYQCMDPLPNGRERTFRFIIFTLELGKSNPHYAIQDISAANWYNNPIPYNVAPQNEQDRMFPVPWYVSFDPFLYIVPTDPAQFPVGVPKDRFRLETYIIPAAVANVLQLLRPGSIIIDNINGYVYKITEILDLPGGGGHQIRLDRNLEDYDRFGVPASFQNFWVIPPAINSDRLTFADTQPVIDVTEKVIQF